MFFFWHIFGTSSMISMDDRDVWSTWSCQTVLNTNRSRCQFQGDTGQCSRELRMSCRLWNCFSVKHPRSIYLQIWIVTSMISCRSFDKKQQVETLNIYWIIFLDSWGWISPKTNPCLLNHHFFKCVFSAVNLPAAFFDGPFVFFDGPGHCGWKDDQQVQRLEAARCWSFGIFGGYRDWLTGWWWLEPWNFIVPFS